MSTVAVNETFEADVVADSKVQFDITPPKNAKYVLECGGDANVLVGVYQGSVVAGEYGKLRVCGVGRRGTRVLDPVKHTVVITPKTTGKVTVLIRPWNGLWPKWDYFTINSYKSTC